MVENPWEVESNIPQVQIIVDCGDISPDCPPECVVITGAELVGAWAPYVTWMTRKGVPTEVVTVDWIYENYSYAGADTESIREFLMDRYSDPVRSLHFVILGGNVDSIGSAEDEDIVPSTMYMLNGKPFLSDLFYADFDEEDTIIAANVLVARVPAKDTMDVHNWVKKKLRFEQNPGNGDYSYLNNALFTYGLGFLDTQYVVGANLPTWFNCTNMAQFPDPPTFPTYGDVRTALLGGVQIFEMMNQGDPDVCHLRLLNHEPWYYVDWPLRTDSLVYIVTPKDRISFSQGCWMGNLDFYYQDAWDEWNQSAHGCFAQVDICDSSGSVAARYNSRPGQFHSSAALLERGTLEYLLSDSSLSIGWSHYGAKLLLPDTSIWGPSVKLCLIHTNNLFGCPELHAWTQAPRHFAVTHPCGINYCPSPPPPQGCQDAVVNIQVDDVETEDPIPGALITLWKEGTSYLRGTTDASGHASLTPGPSTPGQMLITCTMPNYIPYQCSMLVSNTVSCGQEPDSNMQRPGQGKITTLLPALIWNPNQVSGGDSLYQTLLGADYQATLTADLAPYLDSLANYHLFVMAGLVGDSTEPGLSWQQFQPFSSSVVSFLQSGGSLYWQGSLSLNDIFYYAPGLFDYFQLLLYGMPHSISYLTGMESALYGPVFADIDSLVCDGGTFDVESECGFADAEVLLATGPAGGHATAGLICQAAQTHTMLVDFSWARLNDSGTNTRVDLVHDVMDWLSGLVDVDEPTLPALPTAFALSPNYPNPFNAGTTINYALPVAGDVRLQVYDITGRAVATLVNSAMPAGYHQVVWDAKGMSSGLYFLRIQAGEFAETKKMVLMK